jgi:hypothetical protein
VTAERDAIRAVVLDYVEGWFDGDAARMSSPLHPELVKRDGDGGRGLRTLSAQRMIATTAEGEGRREDAGDRQIDIEIEHVSGDIASVRCLCHVYVDLLHLVREDGEWRIVNAVWRRR